MPPTAPGLSSISRAGDHHRHSTRDPASRGDDTFSSTRSSCTRSLDSCLDRSSLPSAPRVVGMTLAHDALSTDLPGPGPARARDPPAVPSRPRSTGCSGWLRSSPREPICRLYRRDPGDLGGTVAGSERAFGPWRIGRRRRRQEHLVELTGSAPGASASRPPRWPQEAASGTCRRRNQADPVARSCGLPRRRGGRNARCALVVERRALWLRRRSRRRSCCWRLSLLPPRPSPRRVVRRHLDGVRIRDVRAGAQLPRDLYYSASGRSTPHPCGPPSLSWARPIWASSWPRS